MGKPSKFHGHEALDRIHVINCNIEYFLIRHPVCENDADIRGYVERSMEELGKAYQMVGMKYPMDESNG